MVKVRRKIGHERRVNGFLQKWFKIKRTGAHFTTEGGIYVSKFTFNEYILAPPPPLAVVVQFAPQARPILDLFTSDEPKMGRRRPTVVKFAPQARPILSHF